MILGLRGHMQVTIAPERIPLVLEKIDENFLQLPVNADDGNARQRMRKVTITRTPFAAKLGSNRSVAARMTSAYESNFE